MVKVKPDVGGPRIARVALDTPLRSLFDYLTIPGAEPGRLVSVEFGRRQMVGVVVELAQESEHPAESLKPVLAVFDALPPLSPEWLALCKFAGHYYLRGPGEVMLPALPSKLRVTKGWERLAKAMAKPLLEKKPRAAKKAAAKTPARKTAAVAPVDPAVMEAAPAGGLPADALPTDALLADAPAEDVLRTEAPRLLPGQRAAADVLAEAAQRGGFAPFLLYGVTGSGKTEVYLDLVARILAAPPAGLDAPASQVLLLVPEINLTPQLEAGLRGRFAGTPIAVMHSGLAEGERTRNWLAAHLGQARIVVGTRLAVLASLPGLRAIIVDEEHDPSYKQQEGLRYSARDLAVWRARELGIPVVLGSATPSLESWARSETHYTRLELAERVQPEARLPAVKLIDQEAERKNGRASADGISQPLREAIAERLRRGEQSLLYLNRRGYAPVLNCDACGWLSNCTRCSAHLVMHRQGGANRLRCHHCGLEARVPQRCPDCGNADLAPLGRGTQRVEETLAELFPQARVARIDADATRLKGSAQALFDEVHAGKVDILIGTQMIAKGHDFQRVTLVGILNPDTALVSQDCRASERLFALLMQVAGRAGRAGMPGEVLVQTRYPRSPVYQALRSHDYPGHARSLLDERRSAGLPPFSFQALLTVEARDLAGCMAFLRVAREAAETLEDCAEGRVVLFDPVPRAMVRVANRDRAQLLVESGSRAALQRMLDAWMPLMQEIRPRVSWQIERDPASV
ncbi:MAG: primosomal protein N' [Candidatus Protistobacter heckmanni]|nr:primosomal protein N' [Candidatus Protistobacter heckmanni]